MLAAWAAIVFGALLRIGFFATDRPLWHDEAMLAANLIENDYAGLTKPLIYGQVAPVGYLFLERFLLDALGDSERTLRLPSLLSGLLCLPAFLLLARRLLPARAGVLAVLLFAVSEPLVYYSVELKPYGFDVLFTLLFVWLAARIALDGWRWLDIAAVAVTGLASLWFSYPIVFIIATTGCCLLAAALQRRDWPRLIAVAVACGLCAAEFLIIKKLFVDTDSPSAEHHKGFWLAKKGFMPLPPKSLGDLEWFALTPFNFFIDPMRYKAMGLAMGLALAGAAIFWKRQRLMLFVLLLPIPLIAAVSSTHLYPFGTQAELKHPILGRVLLFIVPLVLLLMASGLAWAGEKAGRRGKPAIALLLALLLAHPTYLLLWTMRNPDEPHDIRPAMRYLEANAKAGDMVYVNYPGLMVSNYYWNKYKLDGLQRFTVMFEGGDLRRHYYTNVPQWSLYDEAFRRVRGRRVWVFFLHTPDLADHRTDEKYLRSALPRVARLVQIPGPDGSLAESWSQGNGSLRLFEMNP